MFKPLSNSTITSAKRGLAQGINPNDIFSGDISGVGLRLTLAGGTGAGITLKASIQEGAAITDSPYTDQGAWVTATAYVINDVVQSGGENFLCKAAHTSASLTEPSVGAAATSYWDYFGEPTGTALASGTVDASTISDHVDILPPYSNNNTTASALPYIWFDFGEVITLDKTKEYWIVLEEVGTVMTTGDIVGWFRTANDEYSYDPVIKGLNAKYYVTANDQWWNGTNQNSIEDIENFDLVTSLYRKDDWTSNQAAGHFGVDTGQESFIYLAENSLVYWFVGNVVHTVDGTHTGGKYGRANKEILTFPEYTNVKSVAESRANMYIGVQTSGSTDVTSDKYFTARRIGVFVWNKRSALLGGTDFYNASGAMEIKELFISSSGDVKAITVSNSGFAEIRQIVGNQLAVVHTFEKDGYPVNRRGVSQINGMNVWCGLNGIFYAYGSAVTGEPEQLYKIGDISAEANAGFSPSAIFVGHENSSEPRMAILQAWTDSDPSYIVQKWYPNGDGTIDTVAQTGNAGNVFSRVETFPQPTLLRFAHMYFVPIDGGTSTTTVATINVYYNKSTTVGATFTVQRKDLTKGFYHMPLNKKHAYAVQFEVEWSSTQTLGSYDLQPSDIVVDYDSSFTKIK